MKTVKARQGGFFDPVTGLALLALFGVTGVAIESTQSAGPVDTVETQLRVSCAETGTAVVQEDFQCN